MSDPGPGPSWAPDPRWRWVFGAAALVLLGLAVTADLPGRVLAGAAALAFVGLAVADARARLEVDADGVTVGGLTGVRRFAWDDLETVRVDERIRFGRVVHALELDTGVTLVVLGARTLGADPVTVARRLVAVAPPEQRARLGGEVRRTGRR